MDTKKLNKQGKGTLTGVVLGLLLVIGVFVTYFGFYTEQLDNNDAVIDDKYNETYTRLLDAQTGIETNINDIKENVNNIEEADSDFQAAWNGFKALGSTLILPISFISSSVEVFEAMVISGDFIPEKQKVLFGIAIIAAILFIILAILTGGNPKI